jgi:transposase InsO family protein
MEHVAAHADQLGDGCAAYGLVQTTARAGADLPSDRGRQYCSHAFQGTLADTACKAQ